MEEFKKWCQSIGMEETRVADCDMVSMSILKDCWDYKQQEVEYWKNEALGEFSESKDIVREMLDLTEEVQMLKRQIKPLLEVISKKEKTSENIKVAFEELFAQLKAEREASIESSDELEMDDVQSYQELSEDSNWKD